MLRATPGTSRFTCTCELDNAVNLCAAALVNVMASIFPRSDSTETQPEPEPDPNPRTSIRIKRWRTREQLEQLDDAGIWVTGEQLEQLEALNLLDDAIVTGPYYDLASQPFGVEGRTR